MRLVTCIDVWVDCLYRFCEWLLLVVLVICESEDARFDGVDFEIVAVSRHVCMMCVPSVS